MPEEKAHAPVVSEPVNEVPDSASKSNPAPKQAVFDPFTCFDLALLQRHLMELWCASPPNYDLLTDVQTWIGHVHDMEVIERMLVERVGYPREKPIELAFNQPAVTLRAAALQELVGRFNRGVHMREDGVALYMGHYIPLDRLRPFFGTAGVTARQLMDLYADVCYPLQSPWQARPTTESLIAFLHHPDKKKTPPRLLFVLDGITPNDLVLLEETKRWSALGVALVFGTATGVY